MTARANKRTAERMLTPPSVAELALFTGQAEASFTSFATQALSQATLLFQSVTGITDWPADEVQLNIAKSGVMEFADFIYNRNPYRGAMAKPFSSETIGSYTYTISRARAGESIGFIFWDEAIKICTTEESSDISYGGVSVFEQDGLFTTQSGSRVVLSDGDLADMIIVPFGYLGDA